MVFSGLWRKRICHSNILFLVINNIFVMCKKCVCSFI